MPYDVRVSRRKHLQCPQNAAPEVCYTTSGPTWCICTHQVKPKLLSCSEQRSEWRTKGREFGEKSLDPSCFGVVQPVAEGLVWISTNSGSKRLLSQPPVKILKLKRGRRLQTDNRKQVKVNLVHLKGHKVTVLLWPSQSPEKKKKKQELDGSVAAKKVRLDNGGGGGC